MIFFFFFSASQDKYLCKEDSSDMEIDHEDAKQESNG